MNCQMMRVISSPSSSTTVPVTLIFDMSCRLPPKAPSGSSTPGIWVVRAAMVVQDLRADRTVKAPGRDAVGRGPPWNRLVHERLGDAHGVGTLRGRPQGCVGRHAACPRADHVAIGAGTRRG